MTEAISAVVFDLDGLMFNTEDLYDEVGGEILRRRGFLFTPELKAKMMGRPGRDALRIMIETHGLADTVESLQRETDQVFPAILDRSLTTMPGLLELLAAIERAGMPKAVATSSGRRFTLDLLSRFSLTNRFEFLLTAEDVVHGKPHPEVYLSAAERLSIGPRRMLVLEDSVHGCRAAVAAGAVTVAVPAACRADCEFPGTAFIAESLFDRRIHALLPDDARRRSP